MTGTPYGPPFGPMSRPGFLVNSVVFFDDFFGTSLSATDDAAVWDIVIDSGTTIVLAEDEPNGVVTLSPNEAGLSCEMEVNGEPINFNREQNQIFECRMKVAVITTSSIAWFVGISEKTLDLLSGTPGGVEKRLIGFTAQGDANIDAMCGDGTSETIDDTTSDLVADTYVVLTWKYHAKTEQIRYYVDGVKKVTQSVQDGDLIPANNDKMTITIFADGHQSATAATDLDVDYILYAAERA